MELRKHISQWTKDDFETEQIHGMAAAYRQQYHEWMAHCTVHSIEQHFTVPLLRDGYRIHGYLDKVLETPNEGLAIVDHKTTTEDLGPGSKYFTRLEHDPQSTIYLLLATLNHWEVDTIIWDITRKPTIRPKKMAKKDYNKIVETGEYLGYPLEFPERVHEDGRESPECYGIRVFLWCMNNRVFCRHNIIRTADVTEEQLAAIHGTSRMIDACRVCNNWPQNFGACFNYGRPCDYSPVCHEGCSLDSDYYMDKHTGRWQDLSHSSIQSFHSCPRRFYYSQIERRVPIDTESDALRIGSAWHNTLDLLYGAFCNGERHDNSRPGDVPTVTMGHIHGPGKAYQSYEAIDGD